MLGCALATGGCQRPPEAFRAELLVFAAPATLELRGVGAVEGEAITAALAAHLGQLEHEWHPWKPGPLVRLNAALAVGAAAPAPPSLRALIERSRRFHAASGGLFDPAIGGLVRMWGFHTSDYPVATPLPDPAMLDAWLRAAPSLADVQVLADGSVHSAEPAVQLDFGAIAEGVAAEHVAGLLLQAGVENALLSLGGDVLALGNADGRPWRVGVRDPSGALLAGVELSGHEALFTSGNYSKYRAAPDGGRWPHVLDPRSARPATGVGTVTVLHPDPVLADVAATALFVGGAGAFAELTQRLGVGCALLLTDDDRLLLTAAMQRRIELQRQPRARAPLVDGMDSCAG